MSWLSNAVKAVKKGVVDVGHFAGNVATNPIVKGLGAGALALTGVGIPASAAILGGSQLAGNLIKPGGNIGKGISGGLSGAAEGALAGTIGKGIKTATGMTGLQGIEHMLGIGQAGGDVGGAGDSQYVLNDDGSIKTDENGDPIMNPNVAGQSDNEGGGGGQNILGQINDIAKKVPGVSSIESMLGIGGGAGGAGGGLDLGKLGQLGLAGLEGYNAINLGKKSSDYAQQAMDAVKQNYDQRQPLRLAGLQGMLNPQTNDISSITKYSGPYGAGLPAVKPVPGVTLPAGYKVT